MKLWYVLSKDLGSISDAEKDPGSHQEIRRLVLALLKMVLMETASSPSDRRCSSSSVFHSQPCPRMLCIHGRKIKSHSGKRKSMEGSAET
jgi:hypothetical protein